MTTIWSIGHSTRSITEFIGLLRGHQVECLVDVRSFPGSRHNPQFGKAALADTLGVAGIRYVHLPALGGRKPHGDPCSPNAGWEVAAFRNYADYMQTDTFAEGLGELLEFAQTKRTAFMCSEAKWWSCHRRLISDALLIRGQDVRHICKCDLLTSASLTPFARVQGTQLTYPETKSMRTEALLTC